MTLSEVVQRARAVRDVAGTEHERSVAVLTELRSALDGPTPPAEDDVERAVRATTPPAPTAT